MEEDQLRGRGGSRLDRDGHPRDVHTGAPAGHRRQLHRLPGAARRARQARRAKSSVPGREQRTGPAAGSAIWSVGCPQAKLGVFWHTQGSGKTVSMIFFTQKVLRTMAGNWTFVIVTDRDDLDEQAYKEFAAAASSRSTRRPPHRRTFGAATRGPAVRIHADPEVPDRTRRTTPSPLGPRRRHRHHG